MSYPIARVYTQPPVRPPSETRTRKVVRLLRMIFALIRNQYRLAFEIWRRKPDAVLFDSYMEYLSPLWVWPHVLLSRVCGVTYVANLHDPVRDFQVGPAWWHHLSISMGYWPLDIVVVHQHLPERDIVPGRIRVVEAPVGVYDLTSKAVDVRDVRMRWGISEPSVVFLSFGFIRDGKNLDLLIRSLVDNPVAVLIVMGRAQSSTQKPLSFYEELAEQLGVSGRVQFRGEFVPEEEISGYFVAADFVAITYSKDFHSQSGVLNIAANARKPVLASAGDSPLKECVERFQLGEFVEPDSLPAIKTGMARLCAQALGSIPCVQPNWDGYVAYASWDSNAAITLEAIRSRRQSV